MSCEVHTFDLCCAMSRCCSARATACCADSSCPAAPAEAASAWAARCTASSARSSAAATSCSIHEFRPGAHAANNLSQSHLSHIHAELQDILSHCCLWLPLSTCFSEAATSVLDFSSAVRLSSLAPSSCNISCRRSTSTAEVCNWSLSASSSCSSSATLPADAWSSEGATWPSSEVSCQVYCFGRKRAPSTEPD